MKASVRKSRFLKLSLCLAAYAIGGTLSSLNAEPSAAPASLPSSFKGTSLIMMPTTKPVDDSTLEIHINHRFGSARTGVQDFFGLDGGANVQLSADYGITRWMSLGIARTSDYKTYEGRMKIVPIEQSDSFPFSLGFFLVAGQETSKQQVSLGRNFLSQFQFSDPALASVAAQMGDQKYVLSDNDKRSYLGSILLSRRFGSILSLQISPMYVHRNFVKSHLGNDRAGFSFGGRIKLSEVIDLTFETIAAPKRDYIGDDYDTLDRKSYGTLPTLSAAEINPGNLRDAYLRNVLYHQPVPYYYVPFSLGIDIDTGGHVFQIFFSNSRVMAQTQLLRGADFDFGKKDYVIGFNLSRLFWFSDDSSGGRAGGSQ